MLISFHLALGAAHMLPRSETVPAKQEDEEEVKKKVEEDVMRSIF